jgi:predicted ATPase with chaperone activity
MGGEVMDLADAITLVREQIDEARKRVGRPGSDSELQFGLGEITVELGMELTRTEGGTGGLRFGVIGLRADFGAKMENADKTSHKVTIRLTPRLPDGGDVNVKDWD